MTVFVSREITERAYGFRRMLLKIRPQMGPPLKVEKRIRFVTMNKDFVSRNVATRLTLIGITPHFICHISKINKLCRTSVIFYKLKIKIAIMNTTRVSYCINYLKSIGLSIDIQYVYTNMFAFLVVVDSCQL